MTTQTSTARKRGSNPYFAPSWDSPYPLGRSGLSSELGRLVDALRSTGSRHLTTGVATFRSCTPRYRTLEQVGQPAAQGLAAAGVRIHGHQLPHALERELRQARRILARGRDRLADDDPDPLAEPQVLRARQRHRNHGHTRLDREVRKSLVKG